MTLSVYDVEKILEDVKFENWGFKVVGKPNEKACADMDFETYKKHCMPFYLQVTFVGACTSNGEVKNWQGRKWMLSQFMVRSEIVTTAFKAVMTAVEHETREKFRYRGQPIFGPHIDVDRLVEVYETGDCLDVRSQQDEQAIT